MLSTVLRKHLISILQPCCSSSLPPHPGFRQGVAGKGTFLIDWEDRHHPGGKLCQHECAKEYGKRGAILQTVALFISFWLCWGKSCSGSEMKDERVRQKETWSSPSGSQRFPKPPGRLSFLFLTAREAEASYNFQESPSLRLSMTSAVGADTQGGLEITQHRAQE